MWVLEDISDGVYMNAVICCQSCVRLPRPGSRASSRASSRADWCVSPNVYHREEVAEPNSNRKVTRVSDVAYVTVRSLCITALCVWQWFMICWSVIVGAFCLMHSDFKWFSLTWSLIKQLSLCCVLFYSRHLYRTLLNASGLHISVCCSAQ